MVEVTLSKHYYMYMYMYVCICDSHIFKNNMKTHFISELFCHESYQVHIGNGSSFGQSELATYLVAMVTSLQWQPK